VTVVLLLVHDVAPDHGDVVTPQGECTISDLPSEGGSGRELMGHEVGRRPFDLLDQLRDAHGGGEAHEEMDVIRDTADRDGGTV
jgi:hypothetical protein